MNPCRAVVLCVLTAALPHGVAQAADLVLIDLARNATAETIRTSGATAAFSQVDGRNVLRIATGHQEPWPGATIKAPSGTWDLSTFGQVVLQVRNAGTNQVTVYCRVDNEGADGVKNCVTGSSTLAPGRQGTVRVELRRGGDDTLGGKLFGMRGYPIGPGGKGGAIDPSRINQFLVFVSNPDQDHIFEIESAHATGVYTPPTAHVTDASPYFPLIDTFGQYKHRDWEGKAHSVSELQERRKQEERELAENPGPKDWDRYGGWAGGPQLQATGFFRTEKHSGKWWLVDPEGRLFFSHGIDCVRMLDSTPVEERESWMESFPGDQPDFKEFLSTGYALKGHYAGRSPKTFSFAGANLKRKYGAEWRQACADTIHKRLRSWGLNTIANWSDSGIFTMRRTPYTDTIGTGGKMIEGSEGYWGKFPDVYDPAFGERLRSGMSRKAGKSAGDPWCIGYFSDNEMSWGDDTSLAVAALRSPPEQAAKKAFIADLRSKYGDIEKLNASWGSAYESWEALQQSRQAPDKRKSRGDLTAFYTRTAEMYFKNVGDAIHSVAPSQLYLGCRFAWVNELAAKAAAKHCDVVSYNLYQRSVADFRYPGGDKPLIIGEFHFGALDRGMFHTGLVPVANQEARAQAYRDYVLGALKHPLFVGTHWFQYQDEPTTGRVYDEENYQIGFVDIADTPYRETIRACREVAAELYH